MEGARPLALAVVAVATIALVPAFNALNETKLGQVDPPFELKDPPDVQPPPVQPVPRDLPCQQRADTVYERSFASGPGAAGDRATFEVEEGALRIEMGAGWQNYRGDSLVRIADPDGVVVFSEGTSQTDTLLTPSNEQASDSVNGPLLGSWTVDVQNSGFAPGGTFLVGVLVFGCYEQGNATAPSGGAP